MKFIEKIRRLRQAYKNLETHSKQIENLRALRKSTMVERAPVLDSLSDIRLQLMRLQNKQLVIFKRRRSEYNRGKYMGFVQAERIIINYLDNNGY